MPETPELHGRTLLGHRLLCILETEPMTMRQLHAATHRSIPAATLREALSELQSSGLADKERSDPGPTGGRPRESWRLLQSETAALEHAHQAIRATVRDPSNSRTSCSTKTSSRASRRRKRRRKPVPADVANEICAWLAEGRYLRAYCRQPGAPSTRTVYAWTAKDPGFAREFRSARDFGEMMIREEYLQVVDSAVAMATVDNTIRSRREFNRRFIRPIDLRLQRWRRWPRREDAHP